MDHPKKKPPPLLTLNPKKQIIKERPFAKEGQREEEEEYKAC